MTEPPEPRTEEPDQAAPPEEDRAARLDRLVRELEIANDCSPPRPGDAHY